MPQKGLAMNFVYKHYKNKVFITFINQQFSIYLEVKDSQNKQNAHLLLKKKT